MQVRIYKPVKNAMQSVNNNSSWVLEFINVSNNERYIEKTLGRISSNSMLGTEVHLKFATKEEAVKFAIRNNYPYEIINPNTEKFIKKSYASNFK